MALTDENNMVMPVAPMCNNGGFGNNFGGDWAWIILLLLLAGNGGWGNGFGGFGNGIGGFAADGAMLYPWMNQAEITTGGFRDQMINGNITSIRDGIAELATQLCNCCSNVQMSISNGFAQAEVANNSRQIANMQTAFASQTAMTQGFNNVQSQLAQCCCDNRLATNDLKYTIAQENCADRAALSDSVRDILTQQNAGIQRILDQLCQDKIDAKNDTIAQLRQELLYARGQASQDVQTARILAGQTAEVDALYNRLDSCPVGTTPVYGRTPIFSCNNGCGCNNNF